MPYRKVPLSTGEIYHIYNKTLFETPFLDDHFANRFLDLCFYYRSVSSNIPYSRIKELSLSNRDLLYEKIALEESFRVRIIALCLMPNHYHLVLYQNKNNGISQFMSYLVDSFTRHFNVANGKIGPIFIPNFCNKRIDSQEHFETVVNYVHINPVISGISQNLAQLFCYPYSSFKDYVRRNKNGLIDTTFLLGNNPTVSTRKKFISTTENSLKYKKELLEFEASNFEF